MGIPHVIVMACSKGGVGKTTLVRSLAAYWLGMGHKVAVIDADPQGSIIKRHKADGPLKDLYVVAEPEESVGDLIEELKATYHPVLIDTGGFRNRTMIQALVSADLAIIPSKVSADDLTEAVGTFKMIRELNATPERKGRPLTAKIVLTMTQQRTAIARHVRSELEKHGLPVLEAEMIQRVAYPEAGIKGLGPSVTEPDGAAARDIAAIAAELAGNNEINKSVNM